MTEATRAYLDEVRRALLPHRDASRAAFLPGYMNTAWPMIGLSVPVQRRVAKQGFSFSAKPERELEKIWDAIFMHGAEYEVLSQALLYFQARRESLGPAQWRILKRWIRRIDNWGHSDQLSDLYAHIHERHPSLVYPQYVAWNTSRNPWAVRQSLVGLFYYAQAREKQPAFVKALRLVRGAFAHPNMYVQKGVGWTLREMYNVYPEQTTAFLFSRASEISAVAWQAATEKLPKQVKQRLKALRSSV